MIGETWLALLQCPDNQTALRLAEAGVVAELNAAIAAGRVTNRAGAAVRTAVDGALVREDGKFLYPIVDGIPVLLKDEAIPWPQ